MPRLYLHIQAPFAAFRGMQAGVYRSTMPIIPHSAALGLLLNLAGIEMRGEDIGTTLIRSDVPRMRLAIGSVRASEVSTLYQQLHSYPVGNSGNELKGKTFGAKYWIAPVRREVLTSLNAVIAAESDDSELCTRIQKGLRGELDVARYGLPFAGDNNFLFDRIDVVDSPPRAHWYSRFPEDAPVIGSVRLTVGIDREDASRTTSALLAPTSEPSSEPPEAAWLWVPSAASLQKLA